MQFSGNGIFRSVLQGMYERHIVHVGIYLAQHRRVGKRFVHNDNDIGSVRYLSHGFFGKKHRFFLRIVAARHIHINVLQLQKKCHRRTVLVAHGRRGKQLVVHPDVLLHEFLIVKQIDIHTQENQRT